MTTTAPSLTTQTSLVALLGRVQPGDEHPWSVEFAWLRENHYPQVRALVDSIRAHGITTPIQVGPDGRIWDGHYRIYAAFLLGLDDVPTTYITADDHDTEGEGEEPEPATVAPTRPTPEHLRATREYLGLTHTALADVLGVRERTVRAWESGRDAIPYRVGDEVARLCAATDETVQQIVDTLWGSPDPVVPVYRTNADLYAARPDAEPLTARWWRTVAVRATNELPGARIVAHDEVAEAAGA